MTKNIVAIPVFLLFHIYLSAQTIKKIDHDSTYYASYRDQITGRIYLSRKYTVLKLTPPSEDISKMTYRANTTLNLGIGATYRSLTLNIGIGVNSFNPNQEKGTTHYLDLQSHWYLRKWNFDFLGEFYRGYYLTPKGLGSADGTNYYLRNDLSVNLAGIAVYRALNEKKFSYQAGLVQSEWQKKSAGSFLIGGEIYYGSIHGDSVIVPSLVDSVYNQLGIDRVHCFEIGPGIGYGYTLVFAQHYFLLASATVSLDFRYTEEIKPGRYIARADITPNFIFHAGAGYNSDHWSLSLLWVGDQIHIRGGASDYKYLFTTGNYRLIFAKRFSVNRKVKKALQPINNLIEND